MVFLVPVIHLRVETAAGLRWVDLYGLVEQEPMVSYRVLGLKKIRNVKCPHDRLAVRCLDVESHLKVVRGTVDAPECIEDRADHRHTFVITLLKIEPDRRPGSVTLVFVAIRLEPTMPESTAWAEETYSRPSTLICRYQLSTTDLA